jgi:L-threonylcarbamoyladenylate synthase
MTVWCCGFNIERQPGHQCRATVNNYFIMMEIFEKDIIKSLQILQGGGIILYPTDTIWGIGCDATNAGAVEKIYRLKKREDKKSMIILVAAQTAISKYVRQPPAKLTDFLLKQKKPTTAIFENAINLPAVLIKNGGTIAIRVVNDAFCKRLIGYLKAPLVSTSANISDEPYPKNFTDISDEIKNGVDYIVQHRQNEVTVYEPSAIVKTGRYGKVEIIR